MDLDTKLEMLAPAARFDACDQYSQGGKRYRPRQADWNGSEQSRTGRTIPIFRVLMDSRCAWNCPYCPLRADHDLPRATLTPEELVRAFLPRYEHGAVQGLFLSSGVATGAQASLDQMLAAVELLRTRHDYRGYIHLKLLPGVEAAGVARAAQLADRLSLNLEAPSAARLAQIAPTRDWAGDSMSRLLWARDWQRNGLLPAGLATQFVVGVAGESDQELLHASTWLLRDLELRRVYFGAFRPVSGTALEHHEPTPFVRVQRLQEADWLIRHYQFQSRELPYTATGNLPLHLDPKLAWALAHPEFFPIEINTADEVELLRVPGLGPTSIRRIVRLRREHRFREITQLNRLGSATVRARDFVTLDGTFFGRDAEQRSHYYDRPRPIVEQLSFW